MYVLEKKHISEIAKLYGVDSTYIGRKNNGWNIRIRAMIASDEKTDEEFRKEVVLQTYKDEQAIKYIDSFKNLIDFEKCIDLILDFMEPDEPSEETKEINIYKELEKTLKTEEEIEKLEVPEKIEGNRKIGNYEKKELARKKENVNKKVKTKNKVELTDLSKSKLGIEGEKYVYKNLCLEKSKLLATLNINKKDIKNIIFYNINYYILKEDLSVGHGCDIEIILKTNEHIYLEVKTSYENLDSYSMTYNEFKCNKENQDNYYVIKLSKFKYIKKDESKINMTVIKNPYKIFMENAEILKTITFF